jgi:hypothetical protein
VKAKYSRNREIIESYGRNVLLQVIKDSINIPEILNYYSLNQGGAARKALKEVAENWEIEINTFLKKNIIISPIPEFKVCRRCKEEKSIDEFNWKVTGKSKQTYCKICQSSYTKEHYHNNKQPYKDRIKQRHVIFKDLIYNYLSIHPCVDCGETDPVVLDFDHRDSKKHLVTLMDDFSVENVLAEISKCDIRCANCHRRKHSKESGSYKIRIK